MQAAGMVMGAGLAQRHESVCVIVWIGALVCARFTSLHRANTTPPGIAASHHDIAACVRACVYA